LDLTKRKVLAIARRVLGAKYTHNVLTDANNGEERFTRNMR